MKTYISDIFPRLQRYSEKLDNLALLTNQHWVIIDNIDQTKAIYIFRSNGDLIISVNGKVDKGSWAYLGNNSLLVEKSGGSYLFKHGFFDENVLALKVDNSNEYVIMVNENNASEELKSLDSIVQFLEQKYLGDKKVAALTGIESNVSDVQIENSTHDVKDHDSAIELSPFAIFILILICAFIVIVYLQ